MKSIVVLGKIETTVVYGGDGLCECDGYIFGHTSQYVVDAVACVDFCCNRDGKYKWNFQGGYQTINPYGRQHSIYHPPAHAFCGGFSNFLKPVATGIGIAAIFGI